jgi:acyl-CoA thioesterase FadM
VTEPDYEQYLGDGVYASFDGYQIWLAVNHHNNKVIAIEPEVYASLERYVATLKERLKEDGDADEG